MVAANLSADSQPKSVGLVWGLVATRRCLHSSNEPGELSQRLCHDDSTINIVVIIIIIIIMDNSTLKLIADDTGTGLMQWTV